MTWVKICGITNPEDARIAVDAGADAVGFVFYEKSPRNVAPEVAREIVAKLPEPIEKVGVFVSATSFRTAEVARTVGLTAIQKTLVFPESAPRESQSAHDIELFPKPPKFFLSFPMAWFLEDEERIKRLAGDFAHLLSDVPGRPFIPKGVFDTFLLDSGTFAEPGGTGKTFDWEKAIPISEGMRTGGLKLIVAGGLTPANVREAMRILKPWGVDVSSGVEARPGKKDPEKVRAFIAAVRQADKIA